MRLFFLHRACRVCGDTWRFNPRAVRRLGGGGGGGGGGFSVGDTVEISSDLHRARLLQVGHGGWVEEMRLALGRRGQVVRVDGGGDLVKKQGEAVQLKRPMNTVV